MLLIMCETMLEKRRLDKFSPIALLGLFRNENYFVNNCKDAAQTLSSVIRKAILAILQLLAGKCSHSGCWATQKKRGNSATNSYNLPETSIRNKDSDYLRVTTVAIIVRQFIIMN